MESKGDWKEEMLAKSSIFQYVRNQDQLKATLRSLMTEWLVWVEGPGVYKSEHFFCLKDAKAWAIEQLMVLGSSSYTDKR
jgi:hypothetical protein